MRISVWDRFPELRTIPSNKFPKHILIIPDGNGRWAQKMGKPVIIGHQKGAEAIENILNDLQDLKEVSIVTIWGFSADNWKRSQDEVKKLFFLIAYMVKKTIKDLMKKNVRLIVIGRKDRIPLELRDTLENTQIKTSNNTGQTLCLAVDFGGVDQEIRMLEKAKNLPKDTKITEDILFKLRDGEGEIPAADLLIRTSENRISDIGWLNGAGTEIYFIQKTFPEISTKDIVQAIVQFSHRSRRLGARPQEAASG